VTYSYLDYCAVIYRIILGPLWCKVRTALTRTSVWRLSIVPCWRHDNPVT